MSALFLILIVICRFEGAKSVIGQTQEFVANRLNSQQIRELQCNTSGIGIEKPEAFFRIIFNGKNNFTQVGYFVSHEEIVLEPFIAGVILEF